MMKLHYAEVLNPRKVCALAKHLDAPIAYHPVDLGKGEQTTTEFRRLNPNAKIPVLEDGDVTLWETDAILCHLAVRMGSTLWPSDAARQVEVIRWFSWNHAYFQSHGGPIYFERVIKPMFNAGAPDEATLDQHVKPFRRAARILDAHLTGRRYLLGEDPSIADFAVAGLLPYRAEAGLPLDDCSAVIRWAERLEALPAWRDPFPARSAES